MLASGAEKAGRLKLNGHWPTFWPIEQTAEVMRFYRDFVQAAPRDLNGFLALMTVPPADFLPPELHGRKVCGVMWCCLGSEEEAAEWLAPVQEVGTPLLHHVGPMPFPALPSLFDGIYTPGLQCYWRADFVRELSDEAIGVHASIGAELPTPHSTMHLYPIDGAVQDVGPTETPFANRDAKLAEVIFGVDPDPENVVTIRTWTVDYWDATHPYSAGGAYVNFMMEEGQERGQERWRRPSLAHIGREPVVLGCVLVSPAAPGRHLTINVFCGAIQRGCDRWHERVDLPERVLYALAGCWVLEVAGVADQHPAGPEASRKNPSQRSIPNNFPVRRALESACATGRQLHAYSMKLPSRSSRKRGRSTRSGIRMT